jgi:hypothetical protein
LFTRKFSNFEKVKDIFVVATVAARIKKGVLVGFAHLAFLEYFL